MRMLMFAGLVAAACAGGTLGPQPSPSDAPYELPTPELVAVAPGEIALGDRVQVVGRNLVDPQHGIVRLHLHGTYADQTGAENPYDGDITLTWVNRGLASFEFGPQVLFCPTGDRTGIFHGTAILSNRATGDTSEQHDSAPLAVDLRVLPSVLVERLHSVDDDCQGVTSETIAGTNLAIAARAIGMDVATESDPIRFRFQIVSPALLAQYVRDEWYASWPIMPTEVGDAPAGSSTFDIAITDGTAVFVDPPHREQTVAINPPVQIGQDSLGQAKLYRLATGPVDGPGPSLATIALIAERASGPRAQRLLTLQVFNQGEILPYDGNARLVERYAPQLVSACFPGGDIGRDLTYAEGESESHSRAVSFRWDVTMAASVGFSVSGGAPAGIFTAGGNVNTTWSQTFGVDITESVSSEHHVGENLTAHILPTFYGACYRQTERLERSVGLVFHNACGVSAEVGKAVLTDWTFGFDIATGPMCPPPTNLPGAQQFGDGG